MIDCETNLSHQTKEPVTGLMSGILDDAQELVRQQLALLRLEVQERLSAAKTATILMASGGVLAVIGLALLCFMLVYALSTYVPSLPLWACFGAVGASIVVLGGFVAWLGSRTFKNARAPLVESKRALRENVEWITTQKPSVSA